MNNISKKILRKLNEVKMLSEMAHTRSKIISSLVSDISTVLPHLILIMLYPNDENINHWKGEVAGKLHGLSRMKHNNKYPTYKDLKDYIDTFKDSATVQLLNNIKLAYRKEGYNIKERLIEINKINQDKMSKIIVDFIELIYNNINPNTGLIDIDLIYNELDNMINKYNK